MPAFPKWQHTFVAAPSAEGTRGWLERDSISLAGALDFDPQAPVGKLGRPRDSATPVTIHTV
jgi:hypothetical protein